MRIRVDPDRCEGHARCYGLAPELFEVDDYGLATVVGDGTVPADLEAKARLAIANCPEYAISETPDERGTISVTSDERGTISVTPDEIAAG